MSAAPKKKPRSRATHQSGRPKGRAITQESYERMVESHRQKLGDHMAAAEAGGVTYNTARKAWDRGLGKDGTKPPIRTIISRDITEVRAQLQEYKGDDDRMAKKASSARKDMIDSRAMQARGVRMARNNGIALMGLSANLLKAGIALSGRVTDLMSDKSWKPKPREAVALLKSVADIAKVASETALHAEEMERRVLGGPDLVIGVPSMSAEQAYIVLVDGGRTLDRIRRRAARGELPDGLKNIIDADLVEDESDENDDEP